MFLKKRERGFWKMLKVCFRIGGDELENDEKTVVSGVTQARLQIKYNYIFVNIHWTVRILLDKPEKQV